MNPMSWNKGANNLSFLLASAQLEIYIIALFKVVVDYDLMTSNVKGGNGWPGKEL